MKKFGDLMALWLLPAALITATAAQANEPPADMAFTHARIYTANSARTMAEAVAVRNGRIVYVGSNDGVRAYIGTRTRVEDLNGRLMLPGLIDSHIHPSGIVDLDVCDLKSVAK